MNEITPTTKNTLREMAPEEEVVFKNQGELAPIILTKSNNIYFGRELTQSYRMDVGASGLTVSASLYPEGIHLTQHYAPDGRGPNSNQGKEIEFTLRYAYALYSFLIWLRDTPQSQLPFFKHYVLEGITNKTMNNIRSKILGSSYTSADSQYVPGQMDYALDLKGLFDNPQTMAKLEQLANRYIKTHQLDTLNGSK